MPEEKKSEPMEKLEGTMYTAPCLHCGEPMYVFLTADGRMIPLHEAPAEIAYREKPEGSES